MDHQHVLVCLQNTLSPSNQVRAEAENQLKQYKKVDGYSVLLLQIVTSDQVSVHFRQSASIALKMLVRKCWDRRIEYVDEELALSGQAQQPKFIINDNDKAIVRTNIVEAIIHSPPSIRTQIALTMEAIAFTDFPTNWPDLIPKLTSYLTSQDLKVTHGALEALRRVIKRYEYLSTKKKERAQLVELVANLFPLLSQLFSALLKVDSNESAEMQTLLVRMFWSAINLGLSPYFYDTNNFMFWMSLMLELAQKDIPEQIQPADKEERPRFPWWKAKKHVFKLFIRLGQRYGDEKVAGDKPADRKFAKQFDSV